ncbi:MAG: S41 family peptidase [Bdellovibrionales bacterium]|nr:S41 family peptidase [Bdellovibrionales bacterium]
MAFYSSINKFINHVLLISLITATSFADQQYVPQNVSLLLTRNLPFLKTIVSAKDKDYWKDVNITLNDYLYYVNSRSCSYDVKVFWGCIESVQRMANLLGKNYIILPNHLVSDQKVLMTKGRLSLVEINLPKINSIKDQLDYIQNERKHLKQDFFQTYSEFRIKPGTEFEDLIASLSEQLSSKLNAEKLSLLLSVYFQVAMDPHTSIQSIAEFDEKKSQKSESFFGIGVEMQKVEEGLLIVKVLESGGAAKAGIKVGDVIIKVADKLVKDLTFDKVSTYIKGAEGTKVKIQIQRQGKQYTVNVVRMKIEIKVMNSKVISNDQQQKIAYIHLANFMYDQACNEISAVINKYEAQDVKGYVLDLRGNPGGLVQQAACIGGLFIGKDKVMNYLEQRSNSGQIVDVPIYTTTSKLTDKPLVILVNEGSASASEITSGALQDYGRALVVGNTTYGKGSYQSCVEINIRGDLSKPNDLMFCKTGGLFHLPSGRTNQSRGVVPDVLVYHQLVKNEIEGSGYNESNSNLFPLEPIDMKNVNFSEGKKLLAPTECLNRNQLPEKYKNQISKDYFFNDYQLLTAVTSIDCLSN